MKLRFVFVALMVLAGCYAPAKFTIPDEPKYKQFGAYQFEGGICMEVEDLNIFVENLKVMKAYSDEMRRILLDLQKERGR